MNENISLCENIGALRKGAGMTQEQLAGKLGVTYQAVSKWENAQSCPDITLLPQLADVFGVSLDALFGREKRLPPLEAEPEAKAEEPAAQTVRFVYGGLPWGDNNDLYAVLFRGHELIEHRALPADVEKIYEKIELHCDVKDAEYVNNVNSDFSVTVNGTVAGNVDAGLSVTCSGIGGDVNAGTHVECGGVCGDVNAGGSVKCGTVCGDVDAGGSVECDGGIHGDVDGGSNVNCEGDIGGDVDAGTDVNCCDIGGDVDAGGDVICGDVEGDVDAGGSVNLGRENAKKDKDGRVTISMPNVKAKGITWQNGEWVVEEAEEENTSTPGRHRQDDPIVTITIKDSNGQESGAPLDDETRAKIRARGRAKADEARRARSSEIIMDTAAKFGKDAEKITREISDTISEYFNDLFK